MQSLLAYLMTLLTGGNIIKYWWFFIKNIRTMLNSLLTLTMLTPKEQRGVRDKTDNHILVKDYSHQTVFFGTSCTNKIQ